jgi:hypothetical protein
MSISSQYAFQVDAIMIKEGALTREKSLAKLAALSKVVRKLACFVGKGVE